MKIPWLIHPCKLTDRGRLDYYDMKLTEYESGYQAESLRRIFLNGICQETVTINVGSQQIFVYMVASEGFSFCVYQEYLQMAAEGRLYLRKMIGFDDVVSTMLSQRYAGKDVWFDFMNDVFWTLTEDNVNNLVTVFEKTKKVWP